MIIRAGNFLFRYRNGLFPVIYLLVFIQGSPVIADYRVAAAAGFLVALAGQVLRAITVGLKYIIRGGRKHQVYAEQLVQGGVYAYCRNPLYLGNALILLGIGLAANSWLFLGVAVPFFTFSYWAIIAAEEDYLRGKFGREFDDYCARVHRFLPKKPARTSQAGQIRFDWRRLITAEYGSAYLWIAAFLLVTLKNSWLGGEFRVGSPWGGVWLVSLAVVTAAYFVARWMKKSGMLQAAPAS